MKTVNLHHRKMRVVHTASNGVVNHETIFKFNQSGERVYARYGGGKVERGILVGNVKESSLSFKYVQEHIDGVIAGGNSTCTIAFKEDGKLTLVETFNWEDGIGQNIFEEIA